ncbi:MAG: hypothetical protein GF418_00300 [Chitinivibrionales bacterium]|nr:hypothetical protein [Chitinivibrionales bacterium]
MRVAPCYARPAPGGLPSSYVNKGDTCVVENTVVDSLGAPWFALAKEGGTVFSPADHWRFAGDGSAGVSAARRQEQADRKRRLAILRAHRDWPRRIARAIRDGKICIDMTAEQLAASWGEPEQKSACFTVGLGEHEAWFYLDDRDGALMVLLRDARVIGWSLEKRSGPAGAP